MLETPVAFIIFNRPDLTARVFQAIAEAQPKKLLVVADGPRFPEEAEKCREARAVIDKVDWDCEVLTNYSEANLGCKRRVSSGLDWVFSQVEEAIILEDDCLPQPTFFPYCEELLRRYRDNSQITVITGSNLELNYPILDSYQFSRYGYIWGWATWRRAWDQYDIDMKRWPSLRDTPWLHGLFGDKDVVEFWKAIFDRVAAGEIDTWDYQWIFSCWAADGIAVQPCVNLISNLGFGTGATHTTEVTDVANLPTFEMPFPIRHPVKIELDTAADLVTSKRFFSTKRQPLDGLRACFHNVLRRISAKTSSVSQ